MVYYQVSEYFVLDEKSLLEEDKSYNFFCSSNNSLLINQSLLKSRYGLPFTVPRCADC